MLQEIMDPNVMNGMRYDDADWYTDGHIILIISR